MTMFQKATKAKARLRAAIFGPSGSGKTYTALRIAKGIGGKIAVIDTERMSASKYADRFEFDAADLTDRTPEGYCQAMYAAARAGYGVLVIDSVSHAWQELCAAVEKIAQAKYRGNTWSAWSEGTPQQRMLVDAILDYPGHVICTMRSKTEWQTSTGDNGKSRPVRVGLAPEQGKGIEYEFDLLLEMTTEHVAHVIKDRTGKWQDKIIDKPGEEFGAELAAWLSDGAEAAAAPVSKPQAKPKASDPPTEPQPQQETPSGVLHYTDDKGIPDNARERSGVVKTIASSSGEKNGKRWTRYGVLLVFGKDELWLNTFSETAAQVAESLKGKQVIVHYTKTERGANLHGIVQDTIPF